MRPGLVSSVVRVRKTLKESWDSVCGGVSKVTEVVADAWSQKALNDRDSAAEADTTLLNKSSENGSHYCKYDESNLKSTMAAGGLLGHSDDSITRLENIIEGDKSCGEDDHQCNPCLGVGETEMQSAGEKCSAGVSEAESNCETIKAKNATKTYVLSDIMSKRHWDGKKISGALGKRTAGNKNEQLRKEVRKQRGSKDWEALSGLDKSCQGTEVSESDNLLSLKHDVVRKATVSKHNDGKAESQRENVTLVGEKSNQSNETSIGKPVSSLTGNFHSSPINSDPHITMNPFVKQVVAEQSEDCINRDNLGFDEALRKSLNTSGDMRQGGIIGLIDCLRHLQSDQVRDSCKLPDIPQSKLVGEKCCGKLIKSSCESEFDNESQTSHATLMKTNEVSKRERPPQMEVNLAAHAHSMTLEPGKDGRPSHNGNIRYSSISSSFRYQKKYTDKLIIRFWRTNRDYSLISTALAKHGPISLQPLFRGSEFEDICVQVKERAELPAAAMAVERLIQSQCITAYLESTSAKGTGGRVSIPGNNMDPDFPSTLLKNPAKTIKIMGLTEDVSLQQLKEVLNFIPSSLTNLVLGSSNSFAFAEFKTLESAEKAITKHSISLAGKQLNILRVDPPRTTVVRISNFSSHKDGQLWSVCSEYGAVRRVLRRAKHIVDVHFEVIELPNMLRIVNSLNGMGALGTKISAAPAPVIPPEVVDFLWSQPEGRQHLTSVILGLVEKISDVTIADELKQKTSRQLLSWH